MTNSPAFRCHTQLSIVVFLGLLILTLPTWAQHSHETTPDPGFRPESEHTAAFLEALDTTTITVYPSLVRRASRTAVSFASQEQIVTYINANKIASAVARMHRIDLGQLQARSQWDTFNGDMLQIAEALQTRTADSEYRLVMEFLLPVNNQTIFGIHCYILDARGQSVFSFLLNSHHSFFADARLHVKDSSEAARAGLIERATQVGLLALQAQLEHARVCRTHTPIRPIIPPNGLIDNFEAELPAGTDIFGNKLGFMTFSDNSSSVEMSTTDTYPRLPPKIGKNTVLRLDMNVANWAGALHVFENFTNDQWVSLDWSAFDELGFWFYGNQSGVSLFVDVLDNRSRCSTKDDAERYVYEFTDDFSGWERITVPFTKMSRKEIGNGAPNDGLNLSAVHGWAIGALDTGGPLTFYIDDVEVRKTPAGVTDYPINERPMYGGLEKTTVQKRADKQYIKTMTRGGQTRAEAAEKAAQSGWNVLYRGDSSTAIKRFNQAWLLDPANQLALWGFATISGNRNQIEDAVRFFQMAIANGPENQDLKRDYKFALKQLAKLEAENNVRQADPHQ